MSRTSNPRLGRAAAAVTLAIVLGTGVTGTGLHASHDGEPHLLISEVMTGGQSASDEFIELYNPAAEPLPLEGLELVYVSASGATVSPRAAWALGAPPVPAGGHVLVANEGGAFAAIGDATYASGMAATGGSVALRIQGAATPLDAVGWGTAGGGWPEGEAAPAPAAGSSLERRPGGSAGSAQDSGDNATDFVVIAMPDPQNLGSPPVPDPDATPAPTALPTPAPTKAPPDVTPIATARALPDGSVVTVRGVALTGSAFTDGGGYLDDGTAGIAVIVGDGSFERGDVVEVRGEVDDRFHQRTVRAAAGGVAVVGADGDPAPIERASGSVDESTEGRLVLIGGTIAGKPTQLVGGLAYDVDDGSGSVRVIVGSATGIDTSSWLPKAAVGLVGVVGQRDSTGGGTAGYRVQPRAAADVKSVTDPEGPGPGSSTGPSATPAPGGGEEGSLNTIAEARTAAENTTVRVRGVVTLPSGIVDAASAVIQDDSAAILVRLFGEAGSVRLGEHVEIAGRRATLAGMATIQVTVAPSRLGARTAPAPLPLKTGDAGEDREARLVRVRGALVGNASGSSTGSVSFAVDDGSGPVRVYAAAAVALDSAPLDAGSWVEVTGVLGQETSGSAPLEGYRLWMRGSSDIRLLAPAGSGTGAGADGGTSAPASGPVAPSLDDLLDGRAGTAATVEATLVSGRWPELRLSGLLWDGRRLVGLDDAASTRRIVSRVLRGRTAPVAILISGAGVSGMHAVGIPLLRLGAGAEITPGGTVAAPLARLPDSGTAWVELIGRLPGDRAARRALVTADGAVPIEVSCRQSPIDGVVGLVAVTGIGTNAPPQLLVHCHGLERAPTFAPIAAGPPGTRHDPRPASRADVPPGEPDRLLPAALLGLAAAGLGAAAGWRAWRRVEADGGDVEAERGASALEPGRAPSAEASVLTLVEVPRERGSP